VSSATKALKTPAQNSQQKRKAKTAPNQTRVELRTLASAKKVVRMGSDDEEDSDDDEGMAMAADLLIVS
jgi:hypothetical protein